MLTLQDEKSYSETLDRSLQTSVGKITGGLSPAAVTIAFIDWYLHLQMHPAKQFELTNLSQQHIWQLIHFYLDQHTKKGLITPSKSDKRFVDPSWEQFPYNIMYESFLMSQNWWHAAATKVRGVSRHHEDVVDFGLRQVLDMVSPSNSVLTNPEVIAETTKQKGENFQRGFENFIDDMRRYQLNEPPAGMENFVIGKNIAVTPGKVIYRNQLIELIQYTPTTKTVYAEPILITPAWIMKYYILDLTEKHSLVKYLVKKGHTVFMISWKNPGKKERTLGMEDYLELGIMSAINAVSAIVPEQKIHLIGYCLGGTLSAIASATMARDNDNRLASTTLFAAQTDFTEPGELGLFIDESQITFLENLMQDKGYLDTHQMAGAFQLLRSNDLIWSRMIHDYLLGCRKPLNDLMAWNADATRMPYKMHSEYLRHLFLENQLAEGKFCIKGEPIALSDISCPMFVVATERDHVSPWRSVFKINLLTSIDVTFVLTSGGHNAGIVSLPAKKTKRFYRMSTLQEKERYMDASRWHNKQTPINGSWWPALEKWLSEHSSPAQIAPPKMGAAKQGYAPLVNAPGTYVLEK